MPDFTMCGAFGCALAKTCKRHRDSGTQAGELQSFADWSSDLTWTPDTCRGYWPIVMHGPAHSERTGGAMYRGRW